MEQFGPIKDPGDVARRLAELDPKLKPEHLLHAVRVGQLAFSSCTENHPPLARSFWAWAETVRGLREAVITLGWERSDLNNYSLVLNESRGIAIAVATGDDSTGLEYASPSTRSKKGPNTVHAVQENSIQLLLPFPEELAAAAVEMANSDEAVLTYILLVHRRADRVSCELSLPTAIGTDGRVNGWSERIILGDIQLDGEPEQPTHFDQPDLDVEVTRRA